jgi:uncharacterized RDD family membrane protein YckC
MTYQGPPYQEPPYQGPPQGPYRRPPQGPHQGPPQGPYQGPPYDGPTQGPYQGPPHQDPAQWPYQGPRYQGPAQWPYQGPQYGGVPTYQYSDWIHRVGAYLVDVAPLFVVGIIAGIAHSFFVSVFFWLAGLAYSIWNRWILGGQGQSLGKRVVGIRLLSEETGQPIGTLNAFARDICHFVDSIICYVGYLFPLWDAKRQTLADKIMRTVVVPA